MKKKLVGILLCVAVLGTMMTGCGSEKGKSQDDAKETTESAESGEASDPESYDFSQDKSFDITAGGIQAAEDTVTLAMQKMADEAKEKSGGTISITVSPAAQLGDATSQMEAVSLGTQEMFVDAGSWLSTFVDDAQVTSMFFLFDSEEHYKKFLESDINADMEQQLIDQQGIRVVANNWLRSPRSISCAKEITSAEDLKGLKMRVPDIKSYMESATALGLGTAQVAWGETYLALQQGVVDSCESPLDSIYTMKFYEPTKQVTLTEHIRDNAAVYMNDSLYQELSDAQKQVLTEAARNAGIWYTDEVKKVSEEYQKKMESEGTNFYTPSEDAIKEMSEIVAKRAAELETEGVWKKGLFEEIKALSDK